MGRKNNTFQRVRKRHKDCCTQHFSKKLKEFIIIVEKVKAFYGFDLWELLFH